MCFLNEPELCDMLCSDAIRMVFHNCILYKYSATISIEERKKYLKIGHCRIFNLNIFMLKVIAQYYHHLQVVNQILVSISCTCSLLIDIFAYIYYGIFVKR